VGQDADWWLCYWDVNRPDNDQAEDGRLFPLNDTWHLPAKPIEYIERQIHVPLPGRSHGARSPPHRLSTSSGVTITPTRKGTFLVAKKLIAEHFAGVPETSGPSSAGTLGRIVDSRESQRASTSPT